MGSEMINNLKYAEQYASRHIQELCSDMQNLSNGVYKTDTLLDNLADHCDFAGSHMKHRLARQIVEMEAVRLIAERGVPAETP